MTSSNGVDARQGEGGADAQPALVSDQAATRLAPSGFDQAQLLSLAERCEAATGPDSELDAAILWQCHRRAFEVSYWQAATGMPKPLEAMPTSGLGWLSVLSFAPHYSKSLDAAMTLVDDSSEESAVFWRVGNDGEGSDPALFKCQILVATSFTSKQFISLADTAPLALTAAALRARASAMSASGQDAEERLEAKPASAVGDSRDAQGGPQ